MFPKVIGIAVAAGMLAVLGLGCNTTPTQDGAVLGGALGAASGAVIGHQSGRQGEGALIGAGVGALTGALIGDQVDEHRQRHRGTAYQPAPAYRESPARSHQGYPASQPTRVERGRYETRIVTTPSGETYEERVWVPER